MSDLTPVNLNPEQAVIAAILLDARVMRFATTECTPDDFADPRLGSMLRGMTLMVSAREPIDVISVSEKLQTWEVRGLTASDLHMWISELPTAQNVGYYAALVRKAAVRRRLTEVGVRLQHEAVNRDPGWALTHAAEQLKTIRDSSTAAELAPTLLAEILAGEDDYDWVIPDLLERGDRLLLTGSEGGGKSTLVRQLAILTAAGLHPLSFYPTPRKKVLVVDAENSQKQWRRASRDMVEKAYRATGVNPAEVMPVICVKRMDLTTDKDLGAVHKLIDAVQPDVLFIGPLYRLTNGAINDDDDAAPLLAALDTLRDRGLALVIEAHAGHGRGGDGDRDLRPRGSSALLGWPEFGFGLRPNKNPQRGTPPDKEFQLVRWRGDRDERKWPHLIARGQASGFPWTPTYPGGTR